MERRKPLNVSGSTPFPHFGCVCKITQPLGCWWHFLPPKNPILYNAPTSKSPFADADKIRKGVLPPAKVIIYLSAVLNLTSHTIQNSFACKTAKQLIHRAPEAASYHVSGSRWGVSTDSPTDWLTVPHETCSCSWGSEVGDSSGARWWASI